MKQRLLWIEILAYCVIVALFGLSVLTIRFGSFPPYNQRLANFSCAGMFVLTGASLLFMYRMARQRSASVQLTSQRDACLSARIRAGSRIAVAGIILFVWQLFT